MNNQEKVTSWNIMLNTVFEKNYAGLELEDDPKRKSGKTFKKGHVNKKATIEVVSPDAILKTIYLAACVMWEREWSVINNDWLENRLDDNKGMFAKAITKKFSIIDFPFNRIAEMFFCIILILMMTLCGCVAIIQYMMCLLEYTLIAGAAALLIPFMLFDGLTDMAQKIISTLFQQAMKLIFCVIIINFVIWCFFSLTEQCVGAVTGVSLQNFIYGFFLCLIGGAFMTNAPKLAVALMSGQPQMSMGEVAQMGGAYIGGAHLAARTGTRAAHLVTTASKMPGKAAHGVAHAGVGTAQWFSRGMGAAKGTYQAAKESGEKNPGFVATGAFFGQGMRDAGSSIKAGIKGWYNGSSGSGRGGSGGGGGSSSYDNLNAIGKNYTNKSYDSNIPDPRKESYKGFDYSTADAHNKKYGQSAHYEKNANGMMTETRKQTLGEHLKTQKEDARNEAYIRIKNYYSKMQDNLNKKNNNSKNT